MLYLIGTSHLDLKGYERLSGLLNKLNPDWVGLEETEKDFKELSEQYMWFSKKSNLEKEVGVFRKLYDPLANPETVRLWLNLTHYETRAVSEYCANKNILPVFCDNSTEFIDQIFDFEINKRTDSGKKEFRDFFRLPPDEAFADIEKEYSMDKYPVSDSKSLTEFYTERDKFTEAVLRSKVAENNGKGVYICGLDHIFGDYFPNLFDRITDLNPVRMKLNQKIN